MSNTTEKAPESTKLLLRASEVAERLSIGRGTAYELMAGGVLPTVRIGRSVRAIATGVENYARGVQEGTEGTGDRSKSRS